MLISIWNLVKSLPHRAPRLLSRISPDPVWRRLSEPDWPHERCTSRGTKRAKKVWEGR